MPLFKVCASHEVLQEKATKFTIDGKDILLAKSKSNEIFAFDDTCTHADRSMEKGKWNAQTAEITCPFHRAVFCVAEEGAVKAPPAFCPLPVYPVVIKREDNQEVVYIEKDE